uniref:Uncharacterized protein n=1 Tax=Anguilla anguilla TaxID=7936 RepID=A0A0E9VFU6_ANGAN
MNTRHPKSYPLLRLHPHSLILSPDAQKMNRQIYLAMII